MNIRNLRLVNLANLIHRRNYHSLSQSTVAKLLSMEVLESLLSNISEAIPTSKCSGLSSFNSCICEFNAYKQNWDPVLGRRCSFITEEKNENGECAVVLVNEDEVVRHIPLCLSKIISMFLKLAGSYMEVELTGKFTNRGAGYRLEIPCKYHASGREKVVAWV